MAIRVKLVSMMTIDGANDNSDRPTINRSDWLGLSSPCPMSMVMSPSSGPSRPVGSAGVAAPSPWSLSGSPGIVKVVSGIDGVGRGESSCAPAGE